MPRGTVADGELLARDRDGDGPPGFNAPPIRIAESPRHKSGAALRIPRMLRWRRDMPVLEASTLDDLKAMLTANG